MIIKNDFLNKFFPKQILVIFDFNVLYFWPERLRVCASVKSRMAYYKMRIARVPALVAAGRINTREAALFVRSLARWGWCLCARSL